MMLSTADIERLEKAGYDRQEFTRYDKHGFAKLRNRRGFCVLYDTVKRRCKIHEQRPEGCRIYPVVYSEEEGIVVDCLCPMKATVSEVELRRKGRKVVALLQRIGREAASRGARA
jgi:Fe-S-cluster containining protein